ncbi:type-F conjugative transfer system protein TraW [Devosia sp.]|uniref:type-F conjugative transfer system protein TraW n=1 Tax=Devosia sp. TaxID=1871048 RepID=UPI002735D9F7|nr:type-F conjugative transfer system protein TraW [Devosia sp.]MDP2781062.1 type-F conjugative transfer system protein TraW [Devosia sp.]
MRRWLISAALLAALLPSVVVADDLGVVGPTYEIVERDLLELITSKLKQMEQSGELAKYQEDYKNKVVSSIEHPRPLTGFKATETAGTHYYDPSIVTAKDIVDATGNVLYRRGTRVNPLDYVGWNTYLLFVDGRDEKQLAFSKKIVATSDRPVKIVLVAGEPLALMRKWKSTVYYDQGGKLIKRFSITQVPAIVRQEGKRLRIDELRY